MAYTKLGRIRPVYKGTWSNTTAYTALEMVKSTNGRAAYIALKDVPKGTALTNAVYWAAVLDVSDVLTAADAAIQAAKEAARLAPSPLALTETTNPAIFRPEAGSPLRPKLRLQAEQSGSGNPAPDNVRTIIGRKSVKIVRAGTNLFSHGQKISVNNADGYVNLFFDVPLPPGTYTVSGRVESTYTAETVSAMGFIDNATDRPGKYVHFKRTGGREVFQVTIDFYTKAIRLLSGTTTTNSPGHTSVWTDVQIQAGSQATDYEPYRGESRTVSLGQTVCGGTLDADGGVLTLDRLYIELDGSENWGYLNSAAYPYWYFDFADYGTIVTADFVCSHFANAAISSDTNLIGINVLNSGASNKSRISVRPGISGVADLSSWKAYLAGQKTAGTPVQVCCGLTNAQTVKLSPVQIAALDGLNTVFSDADDMEVTYNKSLAQEHEEIMTRLAALEAAIT